MSYVLLLTVITSYGATDTTRMRGFHSYEDCIAFAEAFTRGLGEVGKDSSKLRFDCQIEEEP